MFQNARGVVVSGGTFTVSEHHSGLTGLQLLHQESAKGAAHDSAERFPPTRCHPATRRSVVGDVVRWFHQRPSTDSNVMWIHGAAGAGKSALAQTICECLARSGHLGGSFFFSRTARDRGRGDASRLFSTIAYQVSIAAPHVGASIEAAVLRDPAVLDKTPDIQLRKLLVEPLQKKKIDRPVAVVIDGLDECSDEDVQAHILHLITSTLECGISLSFIITSRPEPCICDAFASVPLARMTHPLSLLQSPETDRDIRAFLSARFMDIREDPKHRFAMASVSGVWPSEEVLSYLVEKASGQFIYAATVIKFIDEPNHRPAERLALITSIPFSGPSTSLGDLDRLYTRILSMAPEKKRMLDVIGTTIAMRDAGLSLCLEWRPGHDSLYIAEKLLDLQEDDGYMALRNIHALVAVREPAIGSRDDDDVDHWEPEDTQEYVAREHAVLFHHKSFVDFLCDRSRAGNYYIDMPSLNARLGIACLHKMENLSLLPKSRINYVTWGYSLLHWTAHLIASGSPRKDLIDALQKFDIIRCYIASLQSEHVGPNLIVAITRPVAPPKTILQNLQSRFKMNESAPRTTACPSASDAVNARNFMIRACAYTDINAYGYNRRLRRLLGWLKTANIPPKNLCIQLQTVINQLKTKQS